MSKKLERNDPCWCGSGKKYKNCHMRFDEKIHGFELEGHIVPGHDIIKTPEQIEGIRESGKVNIAVLDYVAENIRAGISTCLLYTSVPFRSKASSASSFRIRLRR